MKKTFIAAITLALFGAMTATAQTVEQPSFGDNWSIGIDGGVLTPLRGHNFFKNLRPEVGLRFGKQISPVFGMGIESDFTINTNWPGAHHSKTAFDNSYIALYGEADLFNLFGGYSCKTRPFTISAVASAGWGHDYDTNPDYAFNYFATRAGLNFNFNTSQYFTISIKPSVGWAMAGDFKKANVGYDQRHAVFNLQAGITYHIGGNGFKCVRAYDQAEVDALNAQINDLRTAVEAVSAENAVLTAQSAALAADLAQCQAQGPKVEVVKEVNNYLNSVRYVFFRIGSSKITADQMPNVEMIANYMKNHPNSTVTIKGYASKDGNYDYNVKLAKNRAESVKNALVSKYKIAADRITAEGEGIGEMFEEESWNRVSICTLESNEK